MNRKTAPYGTYRDFPKIDLYVYAPGCKSVDYAGSTTWARTCREAIDRYHVTRPDLPRHRIVARFSK